MQLVHSAELEDWRRTGAERAEEHESKGEAYMLFVCASVLMCRDAEAPEC
jgi:hypothetical protein